VPWRPDIVAEALQKLDEAERELKADHRGTAFFFASRAHRIAETLDAERQRVATAEGTRFVRPLRVNLRSGPSTEHPVLDVLDRETPVFSERLEGEWLLVRTLAGQVGWIHGDLLR
jgi:SH3-like domain-containing protein